MGLYFVGSDGSGISLENLVNLGNSRWDNKELVLRLETDIIAAEHQFCTDSNGFQVSNCKGLTLTKN